MKVLVADDNQIVRLGVRAILEQVADVAEVLEAVDGVHALDVARAQAPDVVLLDVRMPRRSGLDVLAEMSQIAPVLMLTHSDEPEIIQAALAGGARGYLVHGSTTVDELAGALSTCRHGGLVLGQQAATLLAGGMMSPRAGGGDGPGPAPGVRELLTSREAQALESAAQGLTNKEIAEQQFLSPRTVKNYLNSAYSKLGVHTRAEAVVVWLEGIPAVEAKAGPRSQA